MKTYEVITVGAGVSGLVASQELLKAGLQDVLVVEAQDYVGGRVKDWREWGAPIELGAEFIHGDKTATWDYVQELGLEIVSAHEDIKLIDPNGQPVSSEQESAYHKLIEYINTMGRVGVSLSELISDNPITEDQIVQRLAQYSIGDYEAGDADELDSGAYTHMREFTKDNGDNYLLKNGYGDLIDYLAKDVPVRLNTPVQTIDYTQTDHVRVVLEGGETLHANKVIITASLGVLKHNGIRFTPDLPADKQAAIARLGMGNAMKLLLRFRDPHELRQLFHIADGENASLQTITCWWASGSDPHVLVGYCGGSRAQAVLAMPEETLLERVTADLSAMIGHDLQDITDYRVVRWDTNPYTRGAYSNHPVGVDLSDRAPLLSPVNDRLYFAGEAVITNGNYATVHGAIESGQRVAKLIAGQ